MTGSYDNFLSYFSIVGNKKIWIVDGSFASKDHISPFDGLTLQNVLHVPKISYNLLSIRKITKDLNYQIASHQVMFSSKTWTRGRRLALPDTIGDSISLTMMLPLGIVIGLVCCFLIFQLYVVAFSLFPLPPSPISYVFPHLFHKVDDSSLSCHVCIRAKQQRVTFPSQPYKSSQHLTLIHSDVWGPSSNAILPK